jgi:putative hydrolase
VSDSPFFGGGDFLRTMLGDLVRMMPTGPGLQWQLAYQLAAQIASGQGVDANPDPIERMRFEELSAIAELHVAEVTGMPVSPAGGPVRLVPASRTEWARRILDTWRPVLDRLALVLGPADPTGDLAGSNPHGGTAGDAAGDPGPSGRHPADPFAHDGGGPADPFIDDSPGSGDDAGPADPFSASSDLLGVAGADDDADGADAMDDLLGQWATAMFPALTAWQVGSVAGHLAERALGPYGVPLAPAPTNELLVVSANIAQVAADWSLAIDDLRLWLCAHEIAYHTVLSRPAVSERIADLVIDHAERVRPDAETIGQMLQAADPTDMASFAQIFGDPSNLLPGATSAELERVRAELDAITAAVAGYAEHVTSVIAARLIGNTTPIGEAMRRRRVSRGDGETVAESLFGLRLDQAQIDRGAAFVAGVLQRSGELQLAKMWTDAGSLPTPAEVDAPGLWLARIELPSD